VKRFIPLIVALALPATALAQEPAAENAPAGAPAEAPAQNPDEELFAAKCASCHSVGKGDRVGPDLKNAHERRERDWLFRMVKTPNAMLDSDPVARELLTKFNNVRMPDLGLTDEQANAMVDLIARCSVETCSLAGVFVPATKATDADVELGRQLFLGTTALTNNGPPCMSCHTARGTGSSIAGGTLAKELTHVFARLGDEGLDAALRNPAFPLMKDIYAKHALSKEEAFALRSFFAESNRTIGAARDTYSVLLVGIVGAVFCLVLLNALWSRRLRGIRKPLTQPRGVVS
jgi:mono/diheme cytochrome c family protein